MSIKVGEIGRDIYVGTSFDLSANTELTIKFTSPSGTIIVTKTSADGVTAPAVDSPALPGVGVFPANTYMLYTTQAGDFDSGGVGDWTVCTVYDDATPKKYFGDDTTLTIEEAC